MRNARIFIIGGKPMFVRAIGESEAEPSRSADLHGRKSDSCGEVPIDGARQSRAAFCPEALIGLREFSQWLQDARASAKTEQGVGDPVDAEIAKLTEERDRLRQELSAAKAELEAAKAQIQRLDRDEVAQLCVQRGEEIKRLLAERNALSRHQARHTRTDRHDPCHR